MARESEAPPPAASKGDVDDLIFCREGPSHPSQR